MIQPHNLSSHTTDLLIATSCVICLIDKQQMSGLSKLCCKPGPVLNRVPDGKIETIDGVSCYIVGPVNQSNTQAIIYATNVFGHAYEHNQKNADYFASQGYVVYIPDLFNGCAISDPAELEKHELDWWMTVWLPKHPVAESVKLLRCFVESIKSKHSALYGNGNWFVPFHYSIRFYQ